MRFSHPGEGTRTGTLVALTADTLEVRLPDRMEPARLPLGQVTRLDVSRGKQDHLWYAGAGLLVGAGVGAAGGAAIAHCSPGGGGYCDRLTGAVYGGGFLGAVGGVLGLVAGMPSERWQRVPLEGRRVSLVAPSVSHGRGIGLRLAF
ncbi:MAG TPA: hypothetical protein VF461_17445 [Gemmatimonadaceae bacterium]